VLVVDSHREARGWAPPHLPLPASRNLLGRDGGYNLRSGFKLSFSRARKALIKKYIYIYFFFSFWHKRELRTRLTRFVAYAG